MRSTSLPFVCLWLFSAFVALCAGQNAMARSLFTVEGVEVDVIAENAMVAREQAFEEAQMKAFYRLVERLAPSESGRWVSEGTDINTVAAMVKDYEVLNEKISDVRYIASYVFRFRSDAVKSFFSGQSLNYSDLASDPVMILPFYQVNGRYDLWSYDNRWKQAWGRIKSGRSLVPVVVPVGDIQDVSDMRDDQAMSYDSYRLKALVERYSAKEAVIAVAAPDSGLLQSMNSGALPTGSLIVSLFRTDTHTPVKVYEFFVTAEAIEARSYDDVFDAAVARVQKLLGDNWKAQTMVNAGQVNRVQLRVPVRDLQDWVQVKATLQSVSAVSGVALDSLAPNRAVVTLSYEGDVNRLQLALQKKSLSMIGLTDHDVRQKDASVPLYSLKR